MADRILLIGCGIFRGGFDLLPAELRGRFEPVFLESMLHMRPAELDERLGAVLSGRAGPALILYGDCSPHMREHAAGTGRARTIGANCARIFLGEGRYAALRRSGAFFLLPERFRAGTPSMPLVKSMSCSLSAKTRTLPNAPAYPAALRTSPARMRLTARARVSPHL